MNLPRPRSRLHVVALIAVGALALFTIAGLVELWPDGREISGPASGVLATESARVTSLSEECRTVRAVPSDPLAARCQRVRRPSRRDPTAGRRPRST